MKTTFQLSVLAVLGLSVVASAAPTVGPMGPSAKMAARLKKNPAPSWLAHYLPDDRYKIAGGIWKYVSTDLDTYVHLPNSPLMLRQSADSVIGFASIADAEEAGYTPEAGIGSPPNFSHIGGEIPGAFKTAQTVTLADGVSTIVIPAHWAKAMTRSGPVGPVTLSVNLFVGPKNASFSTMIMVVPAQANVDLGKYFTVDAMKQQQAQSGNFAQSLSIITQRSQIPGLSDALKQVKKDQANITFSKISLNGIDGVYLAFPGKTPDLAMKEFVFGRGSKAWAITGSRGSKDEILKIMKTFEPR